MKRDTFVSNDTPGSAENAAGPYSSALETPFEYFKQENFEFSNKSIRLGFMRKVFGIFVAQLLFTTGLVALTQFQPTIRDYLRANNSESSTSSGIILGFSAASLVAMLTLNVSKRVSSSYPWNYLILTFFTITLAIPVAWVATWTKTNHVLYAGGITLFVCIVVALCTFQMKFDLTWLGSMLIVLGSVALITLIIFLILPSKESSIIFGASLVALTLSIYLTIFVQLLMRDQCCACCSLSPEEYIVAASRIYLIFIVVFAVALAVIALVATNGRCSGGGNGNCSGGGGGFFYYFPCFIRSHRERERNEEDSDDNDRV